MARRKAPLSDLRLDILVFLSLLVIFGAYYLHTAPILITTSDPGVGGMLPPPSQNEADTLLLLPDRRDDADPAESFQKLDMAYGWYNILIQEQGCLRHTQVSRFVPGLLGDVRLLVISGAAARALPMPRIEAVDRWVHEGGVLLLELPDPRWSALTGLPLEQGTLRGTRRVTAADASPLRGALRDAMLDSPILTNMIQLDMTGPTDAEAAGQMKAILEVDGRPALVYTKRGKGHVYTLTIDLARAITTLQQGRASQDFTVPTLEDSDIPADFTLPNQLVASSKMLANRIPFADLLERNVLETTSLHVPIPRLWYFPDTFSGIYVMTHEEERFGDQAAFVADWEAAHEQISTHLVTANSVSPRIMQKMLEQGHDIQLQWNRGVDGELLTARTGLGLWRPIQHEMSLADQHNTLRARLGGRSVSASRIEGQLLDPHWSSTFEKLVAAQIAADTSYGPTNPKEYGYLFGTGMPFYPLDEAGLLLPVAEIPFVVRDDTEGLGSKHRKMLASSESGFHQTIVANFRTGTMARKPSVQAFEAWRKAAAQARKHNHWPTTLGRYLLFEEARRASSMSSRFFPEVRRLEINANIVQPREDEAASPTEERPRPALPSVAFPQNYDGTSVESVRVNGKTVPLKRLGRSGDGFFHILKIPKPGKHVIHVIYIGRTVPGESPITPSRR